MKSIALAASLILASLVMVGPAAAATEQQDKMTQCNAKAGDKKGDERKAFMKECLSAKKPAEKSATTAQSAQQEKMKTCNKEAGEKKLQGDERKKFMSSCLKG